jgi:hypothetical protein
MASGAVGGSIVPVDAVEDILLCRVDVLCRRNNEPARAGRGPVGARLAILARASVIVVSIASIERFPPIPLSSTADGRFMRSLDAVAILLCKSSKLGEGRKS